MQNAPFFRLSPMELTFGVICFIPALFLGLAIGAVILRAACSIYNSLVGGEYTDSGVPSPGFGWAMVIFLVNGLVGAVVGFVIGFGFGVVAQQMMLPPLQTAILTQAVAIPVGFLINAAFTSIMLPTTFGRSCLVVLIQYLIMLLIVVVVGGVLFASFATMRMNG